jgi:GntR family transcriptional regulator
MITFQLDPKSGVPIYRQIQDLIRYGIASGLLTPGEQLPTVRALAVELSVTPSTVIKAYSELEREGILTTEQGSGTFVAEQPMALLSEGKRQAKLDSLCSEFLAQVARYGFSPEDILRTIQDLIERRSPHEQRLRS